MSNSTDTAWKLHAAQVDWTGKVDSKASFALALESAALVATLSLTVPGRPFASLQHWYEVGVIGLGVLLVLAGGLLATLVVIPRLRSSELEDEYERNFIYFGHLRYWDAEALAARLAEGDLDAVLCRQITTMARISWYKHRLVQWSMRLGGLGILLIVVLGTSTALS